ncbi:MAG TPA: hypothetical protein VGM65_06070 [Candidatus Udaeobacter sp.]|jgi:hypothetical protein
MAQAVEKYAQPYRRHIVGLPLQRSLFGQAARAATTIGLPGLSSELDFPAWLDENGDLFLDRSKVTALTKALPSWFTPENLELMRATHAAACGTLVDATEKAARVAVSLSGAAARRLTDDLANGMALVLAYGVLSKFVPDILLGALTDAGDVEPPPFPEKSAGAELMQNTFALYQACRVLDYSPQRLQQEWPRVSPEVFQLVSEFCNRQTGFGPLAWDAPGYEDPNYVVGLLHSAFDEVNAEQVRQRLSFAQRPVVARPTIDVPTKIAPLRRVLGFWLDFLERETWYVRRAFYVGMIPLLRQLAAEYRRQSPPFELANLLFLDIGELIAGVVDPAVIRTRRYRYMENTEYLSLHGIESGRLASMLGNS